NGFVPPRLPNVSRDAAKHSRTASGRIRTCSATYQGKACRSGLPASRYGSLRRKRDGDQGYSAGKSGGDRAVCLGTVAFSTKRLPERSEGGDMYMDDVL